MKLIPCLHVSSICQKSKLMLSCYCTTRECSVKFGRGSSIEIQDLKIVIPHGSRYVSLRIQNPYSAYIFLKQSRLPWNFSSRDKISPLSFTVTLGVNECIDPRFPTTPTVTSTHLLCPSQMRRFALSFTALDETIISSVSIKGSKIKSSGGGLGISITPCAYNWKNRI